jgi:hypothetical protein
LPPQNSPLSAVLDARIAICCNGWVMVIKSPDQRFRRISWPIILPAIPAAIERTEQPQQIRHF